MFEVLHGETASAPLVLQFIKGVLAVSTITVDLRRSTDFVWEAGGEQEILVATCGVILFELAQHEVR